MKHRSVWVIFFIFLSTWYMVPARFSIHDGYFGGRRVWGERCVGGVGVVEWEYMEKVMF